MSKTPQAPQHLHPATRQWWAQVLGAYVLEEHHQRLLTLACEALDRCSDARDALAAHGTVYMDRFDQPRARPEVAIERDSRLAFARLIRELQLDVGADAPRAPLY
jgi:phage terminase small subunit